MAVLNKIQEKSEKEGKITKKPKLITKKPLTKPVVKTPMKPTIKPAVKTKPKIPAVPEERPIKTPPGMITTSIPKLDGLLGGGIKKNSLTCVWGKQGAEGSEEEFIYQIANSASKSGKVFYLTNEKTPDSVSNEIKSLGFKGKINFIDATGKNKGKLTISDPGNSDEIIKDLEIIVKKIKDPVIIIDSLSMLMQTTGQNTDLLQRLKDLNATIVVLLKEEVSQSKFLPKIEEVCVRVSIARSVL